MRAFHLRSPITAAATLTFVWGLRLTGGFALDRLSAEDPLTRQQAIAQLMALASSQREAFVPDLVKAFRSASESDAPRAYRLLLVFAKIGPPAAEKLTPLLTDRSTLIRGFAAKAVAIIRPVDAENLRQLRALLDDKELWVRGRAAESLLSIVHSDDKAQAIIREETRGNGEPASADNVQARFVRSGPLSGTAVTDAIESLASDQSFTVFSAVGDLAITGASVVPALLDAVKSPNSDRRAGAMEALQGMHLYRPDIEAAAIQALKDDPSERVRLYAVRILFPVMTEPAQQALLQNEIKEKASKEKRQNAALLERTQTFTRSQVLASIPSDPDHSYPLEVSESFETRAPDGTKLFTVLRTGTNRADLLRVWSVQGNGYHLLLEKSTEDDSFSRLSAQTFRYRGKVYLHLTTSYSGNGHDHTDEFLRVESGRLTRLVIPKGLPVKLASDEQVMNGFQESFRDDDLSFEFSIWKDGDGHCCPSAGRVKGTYTIAGDELQFASFQRLH